MQEGMEVLAWAVHALVGVLSSSSVGRLRESSQMSAKVSSSPSSAATSSGSSRGRLPRRASYSASSDACAVGAHVVPGDQRAEFGQAREGLGARVGVLGSRLAYGTEPAARRRAAALSPAWSKRSSAAPASTWLLTVANDLTNPSRGRCPQRGFHLHALQHHQRGTGLDLVAHRHRHGDHHGRRRGADQAGFVLADAVTDAVHLDQEPGGARDRDDVETVVARGSVGSRIHSSRSTSTTSSPLSPTIR